MIDTPEIVQSAAQLTAVIHLTIAPAEMRTVVGPGIGEVRATLAAQDIAPVGPWFIHMLKMDPSLWDFEICVPVKEPVVATGRVEPGRLPAAKVVRTIHHGGYEGLSAAWAELDAWVASKGYKAGPDLWDVYLVGPESSRDPSTWRTELNRPLIG